VLSPEIVVLVPVPVEVIPPGLRVRVHVPVAGNPFRITLPVETVHVGDMVVPTEGAEGVVGCVFMINPVVAPEVQPTAFVTVYM
jgi:hypothetical protein